MKIIIFANEIEMRFLNRSEIVEAPSRSNSVENLLDPGSAGDAATVRFIRIDIEKNEEFSLLFLDLIKVIMGWAY